MKKCPYCAEEIQDEAAICRYCGKELNKPEKKKFRVPIMGVVLILLLAVLGAGYYYYAYGPCGTNKIATAGNQMHDILIRFDDANQVASSTARINLNGPVGDLQQIERDAEKMDVPECLKMAKLNLLLGMSSGIDGYISFMKQDADAAVSSHFDLAAQYFSDSTNEVARVKSCAPFCGLPTKQKE